MGDRRPQRGDYHQDHQCQAPYPGEYQVAIQAPQVGMLEQRPQGSSGSAGSGGYRQGLPLEHRLAEHQYPERSFRQDGQIQRENSQGGRSQGSQRSIKSWADVDDESEDEVNNRSDQLITGVWNNSGSERCGRSDSESSRSFGGNGDGMIGSRPPSSSGSRQGSRPNSARKLCNKSISKGQVTPPASSSSMGIPLPLQQHMGDDTPPLDASSMSEGTSGMISTRSTEDSCDGSGTMTGGYSVGSARHDVGGCKPCLFVHTHVGCQNGSLCEFCHYVHKRKSKPRPCKGKRDRYRKLLMRMEESLENSSEMSPSQDASSSLGGGGGSGSTIAQI